MSTFELPIIVDDQEALDKLRAEGKLAWAGDDDATVMRSLGRRLPPNEVHAAADAHEAKMVVALNYAFAAARKSIDKVALLSALKLDSRPAKRRALIAALRPVPAALEAALGRTVPPVLERCYGAGGAAGVTRLGAQARTLAAIDDDALRTLRRESAPVFEMQFDAKSAAAIKWARKHSGELVRQITKTTRKRIAQAVVRALDGGSPRELYKDILQVIGDKERADLIARTELMDAANSGQREAWAQAVEEGLLTGLEMREWIATDDPSLCDHCDRLDGKLAELDGDYPDGGGIGPPLHPRCRCSEGISARRRS